MSIVAMKHIRVIMPIEQRKELTKKLIDLGCVDLSVPDAEVIKQTNIAFDAPDLDDINANILATKNAIDSVVSLSKIKKKFLVPLREVTHKQLFDLADSNATLKNVHDINILSKSITNLNGEATRLQTLQMSLNPWRDLDVNIDYAGGKSHDFMLLVCPMDVDFSRVIAATQDSFACVNLIHSDNEQHYFTLLTYKASTSDVLDSLKPFGVAKATIKDIHETPNEHIALIATRCKEIETEQDAARTKIISHANELEALELLYDKLSVAKLIEESRKNFLVTKNVLFADGWCPADKQQDITKVLDSYSCAYDFLEPNKEEEPPVAFKNSKFVEPFGFVSDMYGVPKYRSVIDPNPFMAPFYFIFFGMMLSDAGYGLLLFFGAWYILKKKRPSGQFKQIVSAFMLCGLSTIIVGVLFGGYFGDAIQKISELFTGHQVAIPPVWFNPHDDPILVLKLSLGFGLFQICLGMGLTAWRMIKRGQILDAVFDVFFWYVVFTGLILMLVGVGFGGDIALIGILGVLFTAGRKAPSIIGKLMGGLGAVYGSTGFLSDVLSYARLLALGLATGVIAQVVNLIASLGGHSILGYILFIVVFVVGQLFNLAINLMGSYVHTSRLQYVEFYSRFYESGGHPFAPLSYGTKYTTVITEEK